jgi:hypothetical protein
MNLEKLISWDYQIASEVIICSTLKFKPSKIQI